MKKVRAIIILILVIILCMGCNDSYDQPYGCYKPMVKANGKIYGWSGDNYELSEDAVFIGEIKYSYGTLQKRVEETDKDFTSNSGQEGRRIYQEGDETYIIVEYEEGKYSKYEILED